MVIEYYQTSIKITAADGMVLCDGCTYGQEIYLPIHSDISVWEEMSELTAIEITRHVVYINVENETD